MSEKNFLFGVELDVEATNKKELFLKASDWLMKNNIVSDCKMVIESFFEREEIGGTLNYPGLAIPHAAGNFIKQDTILFIRTKQPIQNWQDEYSAQNFVCLCLTDNPQKSTLKRIEKLMYFSLKPEGEKILLFGNREQLGNIFTTNF